MEYVEGFILDLHHKLKKKIYYAYNKIILNINIKGRYIASKI